MPYSRSRRMGLCAGVLSILAAHAAVAYAAESREFKAGFAERDISPAIGMEQPGGYGKAYHQAFHDPCKVRAAVFDDGKTRVAIVGIDALFIRRQTVQAVRAAIEKRCGIEPESILISASHTHSGGPIGYYLPGEFDDASPLVRSLVHERDGLRQSRVPGEGRAGRSSRRSCAADARRADARCGVASGSEDKVAFNRRFRMKDGFSMTHPGQGNPDIIEPAGPIDPQVGVVGCLGRGGEVPRLHRQLRLPRHDRPGRDLGRLRLLHREDDPRAHGRSGRGRVPAGRRGRRDPGGQPQSLPDQAVRRGLRPVRGRARGGRGAEGAAGDGARSRAARRPWPPRRGCSRSSAGRPRPEHVARALEIVEEGPQDGRRHRVDLRQGDRGAGRPDGPRAGRRRSRSRPCRSGPPCSWPVPPNTSASSAWT